MSTEKNAQWAWHWTLAEVPGVHGGLAESPRDGDGGTPALLSVVSFLLCGVCVSSKDDPHVGESRGREQCVC